MILIESIEKNLKKLKKHTEIINIKNLTLIKKNLIFYSLLSNWNQDSQ
jgi:hypothetical protein